MLRTQVEDALAELVALGMVNSDSFGGLRALLVPSAERKPFAGARRRHRTVVLRHGRRRPLGHRRAAAQPTEAAHVEHIARTLLRRYGVVFWRLLEREAERCRRGAICCASTARLESRGEIRGGRFVAGFTGEQYALPEAVGRCARRGARRPRGSLVSISGADPLNLVGILTPGPRLPALTGNRLLYEDGLPIATLAARRDAGPGATEPTSMNGSCVSPCSAARRSHPRIAAPLQRSCAGRMAPWRLRDDSS